VPADAHERARATGRRQRGGYDNIHEL
jgi:hypothetical protein